MADAVSNHSTARVPHLPPLRDHFWALAARTHDSADLDVRVRGRRYGRIAVYLVEAIDELDHT